MCSAFLATQAFAANTSSLTIKKQTAPERYTVMDGARPVLTYNYGKVPVANVARYHRKALPRKKHEGYGQLARTDQDLVDRLGGLLRLADGLDRRRNGHVRSLRCRLEDDSFQVSLEGEGDLGVELYGGQDKGDLFEQAFRRRLKVEAGPPVP